MAVLVSFEKSDNTMNIKGSRIIFLMLSVFCCISCEEKSNEIPEYFQTVEVNVKQGEETVYNTSENKFDGPLEIIKATKYHLSTDFFEDPETSAMLFRYVAPNNYIGTDTLKLKKTTIDDVHNDVISIRNITVIFEVLN